MALITSPLKRIQEYPKEAKRLIGIEYDQFLALVELAKQRHLYKQAEIEAALIRINAIRGRTYSQMEEVSGDEKAYQELRQNLTEHQLIVDSSKQRVERPRNYEKKKNIIQAKRKCIP